MIQRMACVLVKAYDARQDECLATTQKLAHLSHRNVSGATFWMNDDLATLGRVPDLLRLPIMAPNKRTLRVPALDLGRPPSWIRCHFVDMEKIEATNAARIAFRAPTGMLPARVRACVHMAPGVADPSVFHQSLGKDLSLALCVHSQGNLCLARCSVSVIWWQTPIPRIARQLPLIYHGGSQGNIRATPLRTARIVLGPVLREVRSLWRGNTPTSSASSLPFM